MSKDQNPQQQGQGRKDHKPGQQQQDMGQGKRSQNPADDRGGPSRDQGAGQKSK